MNSKKHTTSQISANVKPNRSARQTANAQVSKMPAEESQAANNRMKYPAWFMLIVMAASLGYGMYQHDNLVLFGVLILVADGGGSSYAIEALMKFFQTWRTH